MSQGFSLKDQLFNPEKLGYLAGLFQDASSAFDRQAFEQDVLAEMPALELKQRIDLIARMLDRHLPQDQNACFEILAAALPAPLDPTLKDDDFGDFIFAPLGELVVARGLETPDTALPMLAEITKRFSMEYAIRPFLNAHTDQVFEQMQDWAGDANYHVRRLVSEGTRPKLPWGIKIEVDPLAPLPLLERLHSDGTRYVTRSVANHLNDLSKIAPTEMMDQLDDWEKSARQSRGEMTWLKSHALRTLIKKGDSRALAQVGYRDDVPVQGSLSLAPNPIAMDAELVLNAEITAAQDLPVLVDYVLWFHRPDGREASKVFKWKQDKIKAGKTLNLTKKRRLKGNASTFTLHPGPHKIGLQVNGNVIAEAPFELTA
ncbi:MAG: hypothetical protein JXR13_18030 [Thalassovita sp.]